MARWSPLVLYFEEQRSHGRQVDGYPELLAVHRLFLCGHCAVGYPGAAVFHVIGAERLFIVRVVGNAYFVYLMPYRLEVAHADKLVLVAGYAAESYDGVRVVLAGYPVEALPARVAFPQGSVFGVEFIEILYILVELSVRLELEHLPVELGLEVPLLVLGEFLPHEHQLLAGVSGHIAEERAH